MSNLPYAQSAQALTTSLQDGVFTITLNRPNAANTLNAEMVTLLLEAVARASQPEVQLVLLRSSGKMFCAGGDVATFGDHLNDMPAFISRLVSDVHPAIQALHDLEVPSISVIQGAVSGAGIGLGLGADVVVAGDRASLKCGYASIGFSPDLGSSYHLSRRVGVHQARRLLLEDRPLLAHECARLGLFDHVVPHEHLEDKAAQTVNELLSTSAVSRRAIKRLFRGQEQISLARSLEIERAALLECAASAEARQRVEKFFKRA